LSAAPSDRIHEFEAAGLLDGLEDGAREARLRLLQDLSADGVSIEEMQAALAEGRLALLPAERLLAGEPRLTPRDVAETAGIPVEFFLAMRQAVGIARPDPDDRVCDAQDVASAQAFAHLRGAGFPEESLLDVTRVLGTGLAQTADAMRMAMAALLLEAAADEYDIATRNAEAVRELLPLMTPLMEHTLRLHIREQTRSQLFWQAEGASPNLRHVWVGFVDMVGFTWLGERIEPSELGGLATRLTDLALETLAPPVRLVKTIGDAAMLVSPAAEPLVESALGLVEAAEAQGEEFPALRAGLAGGVALSRGGDWYGRPVNLASRVTAVARRSSVLATKEVHDAARDRYVWSRAGLWKLKGFKSRVALFRVRRAEEAGQPTAPAPSAAR
jgi:adenylate cyclase